MKTKISIIILAQLLTLASFCQDPVLELTFTGIDSSSFIPLDSIKIMNRNRACDTTLFWPDSALVLDLLTTITDLNSDGNRFQVYQNYPNPVIDQTTIALYVPVTDRVSILISDILGRQVSGMEQSLDKGWHYFTFSTGKGKVFIFTAYYKGMADCIKIINASLNSNQKSTLTYAGSKNAEAEFKSVKNEGFEFQMGDTLLYIGYTDTLQSGIIDAPEVDMSYTFQFAYKIPCPGIPSVTYEGQVYNTVQIFSQCWLKENLNVGTMIPGEQTMTNNAIIEKYCYDNDDTECNIYGGLYQWDEILHYSNQQGSQGICPPGWHIPIDEEWSILEGAVDSQYGIGDPEWDGWSFRGFDNNERLKSEFGWLWGGNGIDSHGFKALPGGLRYSDSNFYHAGGHMNFWSSTEDTDIYAWSRVAFSYLEEVLRGSSYKIYGFSVRCLMD